MYYSVTTLLYYRYNAYIHLRPDRSKRKSKASAMLNSALLERTMRRGGISSKRGLDERSDGGGKRSRLSSGKENNDAVKLSPKYLDDHPASGIYPDTIQSFAAGIKGDVFELFTSIHKSFKVLLPSVATPEEQFARGKKETEDHMLKELEVNSAASTPVISAVQTKFTADEKIARQKQIDNALRLRCSNAWEKEGRQDPSALLAASAKNGPAAKRESGHQAPKVKEGGKVQLSKLSSNPSIKAFECVQNCLLIIGNKRMIFVSRNGEDASDTIANVVWWQSLNDIDGATISYLPDNTSQLEFSIRGGRALTTTFPSGVSCTEVLQIVQSKREASEDVIRVNSESESRGGSSLESGAVAAPVAATTTASASVETAPAVSSTVLVETKLSAPETPRKGAIRAAASSVKKVVEAVIRSVSPKRPVKKDSPRELPGGLKKCHLIEATDETIAAANPVKSEANPVLPTELGKYKSMLGAGVPLPAVMQRMSMDKVSAGNVALFMSVHGGGGGGQAPRQEERAAAAPSVIPAAEVPVPAALMKFKLMLKAGVPEAAVRAKMINEGVSQEHQLLLFGASTPAPTPAAQKASTGQAKLLNLHWEPVEHKREGSIFSEFDDATSRGGNSVSDTPTALAHLASLFGRKDAASSSKAKEQSAGKKGRAIDLKVIDIGRSTNISITLASLRSKGLGVDKIAEGVASMDTAVLGAEELNKISEIAPSEAETKAFCAMKSQSCPELHESELCLWKLAALSDLRGRLQSMRFLLGYEGGCADVTRKVGVLREVAGRVLLSEGLKTVFKSVLDIGNVLNEGTWKGNARAFKMSSLHKLGQTKSSDGKRSLLDYLVELLHMRLQAGQERCAGALAIDQELGVCSSARALSVAELEKDVKLLRRDLQVASTLIGDGNSSVAAQHNAALRLAEQRVSLAERAVEECSVKCAEMSVFVGEEPGQSQLVLQLLGDFVKDFAACKVRAEARARAEEKQRLAAEKKAKK